MKIPVLRRRFTYQDQSMHLSNTGHLWAKIRFGPLLSAVWTQPKTPFCQLCFLYLAAAVVTSSPDRVWFYCLDIKHLLQSAPLPGQLLLAIGWNRRPLYVCTIMEMLVLTNPVDNQLCLTALARPNDGYWSQIMEIPCCWSCFIAQLYVSLVGSVKADSTGTERGRRHMFTLP